MTSVAPVSSEAHVRFAVEYVRLECRVVDEEA